MSEPPSFQVRVGVFAGSLGELARALRLGHVLPADVPLLGLTREVIARVRGLDEETHLEALPLLASVIALKARLLLPAPPLVGESDPEDLEEVIAGVEALAELERLVQFLSRKRAERSGLIAARALPLKLPRKPAQRERLSRLLQAAQSAVREVPAPLLARERLSLSDALTALRTFASRLGRFKLLSVPARSWGEHSTYFAALLEGVKQGEFSAEQSAPFAEIEVVSR